MKRWRGRISAKLKLSFNESNLEQEIGTLRKKNRDFRTLVNQVDRIDAASNPKRLAVGGRVTSTREIQDFNTIQRTAKLLYDTLSDSCTKHTEHLAHFSLEPVVEPESNSRVRFEMAFRQAMPPTSNRTAETAIWFSIESSSTAAPSRKRANESEPCESTTYQARPSDNSCSNLIMKSLAVTPVVKPTKRVQFQDSSPAVETLIIQPTLDPSLPNLCKHQNFCTHILAQSRQANLATRCCIGFLEKDPNYKHLVYLNAPGPLTLHTKPLSLSSLFNSMVGRKNTDRIRFYERLRFARLLATAVLRFHATPWLKNGSWRSSDICLFESDYLSTDGKLTLTAPYIDVAVIGPNRPAVLAPNTECRPYIRNPLLFGLALILIELAFQEPLSNMQLDCDFLMGSADPRGEFSTAVRLSQVVSTELGKPYKTIVERCLYCNFGVGQGSGADLSEPELQEKYYSNVICELGRLEEGFRKLQL